MSLFLSACTLIALLLALHWLALMVRVWLRPQVLPLLPAKGKPDAGRPSVSILVAVRNEADRILRDSLESMLSQDYPDYEVVAVDDHSTDGTADILAGLVRESHRLKVIPADDGRCGRREALAQAARNASGEWLLFTDADVLMEPDALAKGMMHSLEQQADALSLLPKTVTVSFWEQVMLAAIAWLAYQGASLKHCNDDSRPVGLAVAGPYILVRRRAYESFGGYDAIASNVFTDGALANRIRNEGFRYRYADSGKQVSTRMYRSLLEIWEGFTKNAYVALGGRASTVVLAVAGLLTVSVLPWLTLALFAAVFAASDSAAMPGFVASLAAVAFMLMTQRRAAAFMGTAPRAAPLCFSFLGALTWAAIALNSAWQVISKGEVRWKGRRLRAVGSQGGPTRGPSHGV